MARDGPKLVARSESDVRAETAKAAQATKHGQKRVAQAKMFGA